MKNSDNPGLIMLALILLTGFIYTSWPVCLWPAAASFVALVLHVLQVSREKSLFTTILKDSRNTALAIAAGFGAVAVAQAVLSMAVLTMPVETVRSAEKQLADAAKWLECFLSWKVQLIVWAVLLGVSMLTGVSGLKFYSDKRKYISYVVLALNMASSFTFLSASAIQDNEPGWLAHRVTRAAFVQRIEEIREIQKALVAHAWVEHEFRSLSESQRIKVESLVRDVVDKSSIERKAQLLAEGIPPLSLSTVLEANLKAPESRVETVLSKVGPWAHGDLEGRSPTLDELAAIEREQAQLKRNLANAEAEIVMSDAVKSLFTNMLPEEGDKLVKAFFKTLIGTMVKTAFNDLYPKGVSDRATARAWIQTPIARWQKDNAAEKQLLNWSFEERPAGSPPEQVATDRERTEQTRLTGFESPRPAEPTQSQREERKANESGPHEGKAGPSESKPAERHASETHGKSAPRRVIKSPK